MEVVKPLFDKAEAKNTKRGRPLQDTRAVLNGVLWILRTGAPWKDLPERYPPYQTCHRRFHSWVRSGFFQELTRLLVDDLFKRRKMDIRGTFIDGTFCPSKKGPSCWPYKTRKRDQDHGNFRRFWSSYRRKRGVRFPSRNNPCQKHGQITFYPTVSQKTDW